MKNNHAAKILHSSFIILHLLKLSAFHHQDDPFREGVVILGVVFLFQAGAEDGGKRLIESRLEGAEERLHDVVARLVAFAVDQLDEQAALGVGQFLHHGRIALFQVLLRLFDVFLARLSLGQCLHVFISVDKYAPDHACQGQCALHVAHQLVVRPFLPSVIERERWIHPQRIEVHPRDAVALVHRAAHGEPGRRRGVFLCVCLVVDKCGTAYAQTKADERVDFHGSKSKKFLGNPLSLLSDSYDFNSFINSSLVGR